MAEEKIIQTTEEAKTLLGDIHNYDKILMESLKLERQTSWTGR